MDSFIIMFLLYCSEIKGFMIALNLKPFDWNKCREKNESVAMIFSGFLRKFRSPLVHRQDDLIPVNTNVVKLDFLSQNNTWLYCRSK